MSNPILFIDPNGEDIYIHGALSYMALDQLQAAVGNGILLDLAANGLLSYTLSPDIRPSRYAKKIMRMIDDHSIIVNMMTFDGITNSKGGFLLGGAFMGNVVMKDDKGNIIIVAYQEITPKILGEIDVHLGKKGMHIMHEVTEAYKGAKISKARQEGCGNALDSPDVYLKAHRRATPAADVFQTMYDKDGVITNKKYKAKSIEFVVINKKGEKKIVLKYTEK